MPSLIKQRLAVGLAQGLALYIIAVGIEATPFLSVPLFLGTLLVPLSVLGGLGTFRLRTLGIWALVAFLVLGLLGIYDFWSVGENTGVGYWGLSGGYAGTGVVFPRVSIVMYSFVALSLGHILVATFDAEKKWKVSYPTLVASAGSWVTRILFVGAFVGCFWLILALAAALFSLIKIDDVGKMMGERLFLFPATTIVAALGFHLIDSQIKKIRGILAIIVSSFGWLLPLVVVVVASFLTSLLFVSLEPLWATKHATILLLGGAYGLIALLNAVYQNGQRDEAIPRVLRLAGTLGALLLLPLGILAVYALFLRVDQYGWTNTRLVVLAFAIVAVLGAVGYAWAVLTSGPWFKRIEVVNGMTLGATLVLVLAFHSPLADPARLSVAHQVARLVSGRTPVDTFDFNYLRWEGGRYGQDALVRLAVWTQGADAEAIRAGAQKAQKKTSRYYDNNPSMVPPADLSRKLRLHPDNHSLPESFVESFKRQQSLSQPWNEPDCLVDSQETCDVFFADLNRDGRDEIILVGNYGYLLIVFSSSDGLTWERSGWLERNRDFDICPREFLKAFLAGQFQVMPNPWDNVSVAGEILTLTPGGSRTYNRPCPLSKKEP